MSAPPADFAAIRMEPEPSAVGAVAGLSVVVVQAGDKLFALDEEAVTGAVGFENELDLAGGARLLAEGVEGWTLDVYRRCAIVPRKGGVDLVMIERPKDAGKPVPPPRRIELPNMPFPLERVVFGGKTSAMLAVTMDARDVDFLYHDLWLIDGPTKRAAGIPVGHSVRPFEATWVERMERFVVFDPLGEQVLSVSATEPGGAPQVLARSMEGAYSITSVAVHPGGDLLSAIYETPGGRMGMITAHVVPGRDVAFGLPRELDKGSYTHCAWNPKHRVLLTERNIKAGTAWTLLKPNAEPVGELILPRGWSSSSLAWSPGGKHVLSVNDGHLACWRVPAHRLLAAD